MTLLFPSSSQRPAAVVSKLIWPIAAVIGAMLAFVVMTVLWAARSSNDIALTRERTQLTKAFDELLDRQRSQASLIAVLDPELNRLPKLGLMHASPNGFAKRASSLYGFDAAFLVSGAGVVQEAYVDGEPAGQPDFVQRQAILQEAIDRATQQLETFKLGGAERQASPGHEHSLSVAQLKTYGKTVVAVVAVPLEIDPHFKGFASENALIAVAYKEISATSLKMIGVEQGLYNLRVSLNLPERGEAAVPLRSTMDRVASYLVWQPSRPGDDLRTRLIPTLLFVGAASLVFFIFITVYVRNFAIDLARSEERAQRLVGRDHLSGLPNRLLFSERLDQELSRVERGDDGIAILYLDLDRFKEVNDTYGHPCGDDLIKAVARRLMDLLRGADTLARFGGDEFAIIQIGVKSPHDAESLARRILDALTHPFVLPAAEVSIGVSIGIALAPDNGMEREGLMRLADTALYQAKSEGRNRYSFFERQMDETLRLRKVIEDDLRTAIANDELKLHYQPLVSADGQTIVGVEALVRWFHPVHGFIGPQQFIAVAEERGLIVPLGEWVLRRACEESKAWPGLRISVNVSPVQFRSRDFVPSVKRAIQDTGFDATCLELELTEGVVIDDADAAEAAMMDLRGLGVHFALDDFGTGYSSLIYLRRFAFDKIKIDRSFLESMEATGESAILVHSIVHLGRALGLIVTAEGVETPEQHRFLQAVGCHELQGYLFSRPVPASEITKLLENGKAEMKVVS